MCACLLSCFCASLRTFSAQINRSTINASSCTLRYTLRDDVSDDADADDNNEDESEGTSKKMKGRRNADGPAKENEWEGAQTEAEFSRPPSYL